MNATVLPFPPPRNPFQFKCEIDVPEMMRWHNAVTRYRHGLVMGEQDGRETGWINRADDGAECIHVYVGTDTYGRPVVAFEVCPERGGYALHDDRDRLLGRYETLRGALEAIVSTLPAHRSA